MYVNHDSCHQINLSIRGNAYLINETFSAPISPYPTWRSPYPTCNQPIFLQSCPSAGYITAIFVTGRLYSPAGVFTFTLRTRPSVPGCTSITLPIVHLPRMALLSAMTTRSSTSTFRLSVCHAFLVTSAGSTSQLQRCQKESTIFCTNSTRRRGFFVSLNGP